MPQHTDTYDNAYAGDSLRKILKPLLKLKVLNWNPTAPGCKDFEEMEWFEQLTEYVRVQFLLRFVCLYLGVRGAYLMIGYI